MRKLDKPTENSGDVFIDCISLVRNANLKSRLTATKNLIITASSELENKVTRGQLHTVVRESIVNGNVTAEELAAVYTLRMAKKGTPGRQLYDKLIISAPLGICPLCSQREVTTLDHYLPKAEYPRLSVSPINLIPSCSDCNKSKLVSYPTQPTEETIHPYFDDIENEIWLKATILHTTPPTAKFEVVSPNGWQQLLVDRLKFHFNALSINKLYSTHAAVEFSQIFKKLQTLHASLGVAGVKQFLEEGADTRGHANINSWQATLYRAMADDNWFCDGGFILN